MSARSEEISLEWDAFEDTETAAEALRLNQLDNDATEAVAVKIVATWHRLTSAMDTYAARPNLRRLIEQADAEADFNEALERSYLVP